MGCQREEPAGDPWPEASAAGSARPSAPVRLTDQALVAVAVARAQAGERDATLVDLLVGLAAEPDGAAGHLLRERPSAVAALQHQPPGPAPLSSALRRAGELAASRPAGTLDLLAAAVEVGGAAFADTLERLGFDPAELRVDPDRPRPWDLDWVAHAETYGFDPRGDAELSRPAARVAAQVRAVDGGAVDLLLALSASPDADLGTLLPSHDRLSDAAWRLRKRGRPADVPPERWDVGVDAVLQAARAWRSGDVVGPADLVRAAALAGGEATRTLLQEAERR
ncbi:MAG TPA: hypothetical protein VIK95_10250 [Egibacteraceae bacterium]